MGWRFVAALVGAVFALGACGSSHPAEGGGGTGGGAGTAGGAGTGPGPQTERLRVNNGCDRPVWVFYVVGSGGGAMSQAHKTLLSARGDALQFDIPDKGLAAFRMWPGFGCDAEGNN